MGESPFAFDRKLNDLEMATVVEWLLNHAVASLYKKRKQQYNASSIEAKKMLQENSLARTLQTNAYDKRAFELCVDQLAKEIGMDPLDGAGDSGALLLACVRACLRKISFADSDGGVPNGKQSLNAEDYPLGFDTGDEILNDAARVLRLLYAEDVSTLQSNINQVLLLVQNFTAKPTIDA